jgi:hypothetical protein
MSDRSSTEPKFTNHNPSDLDNFSKGHDKEDDDEEDKHSSINADGPKDRFDSDEEKLNDDDESDKLLTESQPTYFKSPDGKQVSAVIPNMVEITESKSTATASKHSSQKRRKKNGIFKLLDENTTEMLSVANNHSQTKLDELIRHNTELEKIEKKTIAMDIKKDEREEKRMKKEDKQIEEEG